MLLWVRPPSQADAMRRSEDVSVELGSNFYIIVIKSSEEGEVQCDGWLA